MRHHKYDVYFDEIITQSAPAEVMTSFNSATNRNFNPLLLTVYVAEHLKYVIQTKHTKLIQ